MTEIFYEPKHNVAVYRTSKPGEILNYVAQARPINGACVAVPVNLFNMQLCARLALPVVPVIQNYDWPHAPDITPLAHQKIMANFAVLNPYSFNLSDMGTMKTLSTLWACDWLMRQHKPGECRALIVAPLSILDRVWGQAIFKNFLGARTAKIIYGEASKRRKLLAEPADFYIINWDGIGIGAQTRKKFILQGLSDDLAKRDDIKICIIDEASAFRDARTRRHRLARIICCRQYLWLLTGTPTPNDPTDAFGLAKLVNNAYGESYTSFHSRTMMRVSDFRWVPTRDGYQQARRLLTPAIRYDIKDVWDGPPLTTQQRQIELTKAQRDMISQLVNKIRVQLKEGVIITPANEASIRSKILQCAMGGVYDDTHAVHLIDCAPRLRELDWTIENANGKIIILAPFTSIVHLIYKHLKIPRELVYGGTPEKDRVRIFRAFQEEDTPRAIIADPGCLAHGLDLWRAQAVIWYGAADKAEHYWQANKRAHRPGQRYPVTIVQFASTPYEREIFRRHHYRETTQGLLLDMVRKGEM